MPNSERHPLMGKAELLLSAARNHEECDALHADLQLQGWSLLQRVSEG